MSQYYLSVEALWLQLWGCLERGELAGAEAIAEREVVLQPSHSLSSATNQSRHATPGPELKLAKQKKQAHAICLISEWTDSCAKRGEWANGTRYLGWFLSLSCSKLNAQHCHCSAPPSTPLTRRVYRCTICILSR